MTYNIRTNGEIWDVILYAKQAVIGSLGKSASIEKADLSIHPECKLTLKWLMST